MKKRIWKEILWAGTTAIGSALFALGFAMFLFPMTSIPVASPDLP